MTCTRCGAGKPEEAFAFRQPGVRHRWCRDCFREYGATRYAARPDIRAAVKARAVVWSKAHPESRAAQIRRRRQRMRAEEPVRLTTLKRKHELWRRYRMTLEDFDVMWTAQGGRCAVCRQVPATRTAVDHCHTTGRIRGILCTRCNVGIGNLRDDPELLQRAMDYLRAA